MTHLRTLGAVLLLAALCALYAAVLAGRLEAQPSPELPDPPPARVEALARIAVAEAGWTIRPDHAALAYLLTRRADRLGLTPRQMARAYSSRHFDRTRTDSRRWIASLAPTAGPLCRGRATDRAGSR